jgi:NAD(P)H dehydrogenase (quinone)
MRILIVHAHHEPTSFNGSLTKHAVATLAQLGHTVEVSDLYAQSFDPVSDRRNFVSVKNPAFLKQQQEETHAAQLESQGLPGFAPQLKAEIEKVERCDALIFQFPLWWFGLPAILKGWVDRVFAAGRVYGNGKWYENGAFKGKRAMISMTTGGPESMFDGHGLDPSIDTILRPIQHGMFWFTGFDVLPPFIAWAVARATDDQRRAMLDAYAARLRTLFTDAPLRYIRVDECNEKFADKLPRFMVSWQWQEPATDADRARAESLIAPEREILNSWKRDGILLDRFINAEETRGWLILRTKDKAAAEALLATLPLKPWLKIDLEPLGR